MNGNRSFQESQCNTNDYTGAVDAGACGSIKTYTHVELGSDQDSQCSFMLSEIETKVARLEDDHHQMENENTILVEEESKLGQRTETLTLKSHGQEIVELWTAIESIRKTTDSLKCFYEKQSSENEHFFSSEIRQLKVELAQSRDRQIKLEENHKAEIEKMCKRLESVGEKNIQLQEMVKRLEVKFEQMKEEQEQERKKQSIERDEQQKYRKQMESKTTQILDAITQMTKSEENVGPKSMKGNFGPKPMQGNFGLISKKAIFHQSNTKRN